MSDDHSECSHSNCTCDVGIRKKYAEAMETSREVECKCGHLGCGAKLYKTNEPLAKPKTPGLR